jgi:APA family basic amino acid/polyamine antiporter
MTQPELKRSISLPLLVLFGLGVTIGAGIYVLLGVTTAKAGVHAPAAFILAAIAVFFSACSFSQWSRRLPVSAGEAAYVKEGFRSEVLSTIVGLLVVSVGVISAAAITVGSIGYLREVLDVPSEILIVLAILILGGIAVWGISESILFAGVFTIIEAGALVAVVAVGLWNDPGMVKELPDVFPPLDDAQAWSAASGAALLAFFAFIGFEDIVNLAEEVERPEQNLPLAIFLTLGVATVLYFMVSAVAVLSVPVAELSVSQAPMSLNFERVSGASAAVITLIAIVATLNGVIIQIVMASRVLYGLGRLGVLPAAFARVHPLTRTPVLATLLTTGTVLILAVPFPLEGLAAWTSRIVLTIFLLVNVALWLVLSREGAYSRLLIPSAGAITCIALLVAEFL